MAKLPPEITVIINQLRQQLIDLIDEATVAEYTIFERYGETNETIIALDEVKSVAQEASSSFKQICNFQLRIAEAQPFATSDILDLLDRTIIRTQNRIPALHRSVEEIKLEWNLP